MSRSLLHLRLERDPRSFKSEIPSFLRELAAQADVDPSALSVVDIRSGCVIVIIEASAEVAEKIKDAFRARSLGKQTDVFSKYSVEIVRDEEELGRKQISLLPRAEPTVDWLHVSDLHVKKSVDGEMHDWMKDYLLDLPDLLRDARVTPRFLLVSGDLAMSGDPAEYSLVERFLAEVRSALPERDAPVVIVPGNHDVTWDKIDPVDEEALRLAVADHGPEIVLDGYWGEAESGLSVAIGPRQAAFRAFVEGLPGDWLPQVTEKHAPGVWKVDTGEFEVGIAGLNSALLCTRGDLLKRLGASDALAKLAPQLDLQMLALGKKQLRMAYEGVAGSDLRLAVMHHPPFSEWFHELDRHGQRGWLSRFDFIHRGHEHVASNDTRTPVAVETGTFEVATGALHTEPKTYRGFGAVSINRHRETARLVHWCFGGTADRWHLDTLACRNGAETRVLAEAVVNRLSRQRPTRGERVADVEESLAARS